MTGESLEDFEAVGERARFPVGFAGEEIKDRGLLRFVLTVGELSMRGETLI